MIKHIKNILYAYVLIGFSWAQAGSYDDFFVAIRQNDASAITALLQRGFDPNTLDPNGVSGLMMALREDALRCVQVLIEWPQTDIDLRNADDESPLMMAALKGHLRIVQQLVEKGADINKPGWAPLHYAASSGHLETMVFLLENSAYIDAESPNGTTPLMMAAMYGSTAAVKLLIDEGADPTIKNQQGLSALDFATNGSRPDAVEILSSLVTATKPKAP